MTDNEKLHRLLDRGCWHDIEWFGEDFENPSCTKCGMEVSDEENYVENPAYDRDLNAAMVGVEWARKKKGFFFKFALVYAWRVKITDGGTEAVGSRDDEFLPKAITLALIEALESVEVKDGN